MESDPSETGAIMPASTVIFDWDGVVIDSSALHERSWEALASEIGKELPADHFKRGFGKRNAVIIPEILGWSRDAAEIDRWSKRKEELYRAMGSEQGIPILDGIKNFSRVSSSRRHPVRNRNFYGTTEPEVGFRAARPVGVLLGCRLHRGRVCGKTGSGSFPESRDPCERRAAKLRSARRQRPWDHRRPERKNERIGACHDPQQKRSFGSRSGPRGGEPPFGPEHRLARKPFSDIVMKNMKKLPLHVKIFIALALSFLIGLAANLYLSGNYVFTQKAELLVLEPVEQDKSGNWSLSSDPGDALSLAPQFQGNPLPGPDFPPKEFKVIGSLALASEDGKDHFGGSPSPVFALSAPQAAHWTGAGWFEFLAAACAFLGKLFLNGLKMVVIPLVMTSIICGVAKIGGEKDFGRLGLKTFLFYSLTGLLAVATGLFCVNLIEPGQVPDEIRAQMLDHQSDGHSSKIEGALNQADKGWTGILEIFHRMVPANLFKAAVEGQLLGLIFFSLLFGFFITKLPEKAQIHPVGFLGKA